MRRLTFPKYQISGSGAIVCVMSAVEESENCAGGDAAAPSLTQGELKIICDDFDECDADKVC